MPQEKLSALLDGECSDAELDALLAEMERAPELKTQWSRLCTAHDARAGTHVRGDVDIVAGVMAQISRAAPQTSDKVVELASRRRPAMGWRSWTGLAAAASVAAVAVTLGLNFGSVTAERDGQLVASAVGVESSRLQTAAVDEDLRQYMIEHSNTLADRGVGGTLSYARFAARSSDAAFAQPASYSPDGSQP